jgi:DNA-binding transcriptional ArsR family regulator
VRLASPGRPKDPFSAALDALRHQLRGGRLILGEPLTITDLADDLGLSATPVREALSRLAGEGLIEDRRGRGYFARRVDVADLVELYGLRSLYLVGALEIDDGGLVHGGARPDPGLDAPGAVGGLAQLFDRLMARAGNRALFDAYRLVADRLAPALAVEASMFPLGEDLEIFEQALSGKDRAVLAQLVVAHHADRQARAGELVRAMRARSNISSL